MILTLLKTLLSDRNSRVNLYGKVSPIKSLQNSLPQGSVISSMLFNVYTIDILKITLNYRQYIDVMKNKLKTRNNSIARLTGTTWSCNANVLRTSILAFVYSVTEYCAPVWLKNVHCNNVDAQLNHAMRIIAGTIKSTQT